ncbi:GNAT family N-acetyltransferase [Streptomyces sp. NPDC048603]|uniref:GNAT family N-acetyltransferase n=1 Tax=Streptomyces sp. NPDC048603 TaxID=3365577 RepID=UPI0037120149
MTDMTFRPAGPGELAAVAELRWRWMEEMYGPGGAPVEEFVPRFTAWARENERTHRCTVAVRDGRVIGMAWLAVTRRVPHTRAFERASGDLQCVYVTPEERDRGVGGELIDAVLEQARELGIERVVVHSTERAVAAYARHGFASSHRLLEVEVPRDGMI